MHKSMLLVSFIIIVKVGIVQMEKVNDQMGQSRSVWRDDILIVRLAEEGVTRTSWCLFSHRSFDELDYRENLEIDHYFIYLIYIVLIYLFAAVVNALALT